PRPRLHPFPTRRSSDLSGWVSTLYYPVLGVLLVLALATLYKLALPRRLPWHRGLPGAVLAMVIFLLSSIGLRIYLTWITHTGYTYGALATPIAWLLFTFFIGLAVVGGAYFNSAMQELWPAKMTRRQRRKWRRLEMERRAGAAESDERSSALRGSNPRTPAGGKPPDPLGTNDSHQSSVAPPAEPPTEAPRTARRVES